MLAFFFTLKVPFDTFSHADSTSTLTAANEDRSLLPEWWLNFDAEEKLFSGTPSNEDQGQLGELRGLEGHGAQVEPAAHPPGPVPHEEDQDEEEEDAHQGVEGVAEEEAGRKEVAEDQGQEGGPHPEEVILEEAGLRRAHADEAEGEEEEGA